METAGWQHGCCQRVQLCKPSPTNTCALNRVSRWCPELGKTTQGFSVNHVQSFKNMYVLQDHRLIWTYLFKILSNVIQERLYEKPSRVQQTYSSLLRSAGQIEDIFLFNRDVIIES